MIALLGTTAQVQLTSDITNRARGAYDILVLPHDSGATPDSPTSGLIEPNYLQFSGRGGISLGDLARIRALSGVDVAAPISVIGQVTPSSVTPAVDLPANSAPEVVRVTLTQSVDDGVQSTPIASESFALAIPGPGGGQRIGSSGVISFSDGDADDGWRVYGKPFPPTSGTIVAVDPVAEQALVGHSVRALGSLGRVRDQTMSAFSIATLNDAIAAQVKAGRLDPAGIHPPAVPLKGFTDAVVPVVATATDAARSTFHVSADVIYRGAAAVPYVDGTASLRTIPDTGKVEASTDVDLPFDRNPIGSPGFIAELGGGPQEDVDGGGTVFSSSQYLLASRPRYVPSSGTSADAAEFTISPLGETPATGPAIHLGAPLDSVPVASQEEQYRAVAAVASAHPAAFEPIADFDSAQLVPDSPDEGRVSLGIYDVPDLIVDNSPIAPRGAVLRPTFNPAGLVSRPPSAIADIRDAELLRGEAPIDAIRIRVRGITTIDGNAIRSVEEVATQIERLGFSADVVIGSSPQPVTLDVPAYVDSAGDVVKLGTVTQRWTTMGASTRVANTFSSLTLALVGMGAAIVALGAFAAFQLEGDLTRTEAGVLRAFGWTRRRVWWRLARLPVLFSAGAAVASLLTAGLVGRSVLTGSIATLLALATGATAMVGAWLGLREPRIAATSRSPFLAHGRMLAAGAIACRSRGAALATVCLLALGIGSFGIGVALFGARSVAAGPTLLAGALGGALSGAQFALLMVVLAEAIVFTTLLWRHGVRGRTRDAGYLRAAGWLWRDVAALEVRVSLWLTVPALVIALLVGWAVTLTFTFASWQVALFAVAILGSATVLWLAASAAARRVRES
ncbi:hypothetical protein QT381_09355 [Galbitalea sp. SE-J8]|uniref:hypothetical protein n=1 Tax=Galbitalea sp. SE-J8 TaxID=3054952 RepID=UPI00259CFAEA|nr:hypothetical protein [Galbitalea sp. SE-J8]MDM4763215.1 hypothetical protein [Galbitalea sp. SE-J8]